MRPLLHCDCRLKPRARKPGAHLPEVPAIGLQFPEQRRDHEQTGPMSLWNINLQPSTSSSARGLQGKSSAIAMLTC